MTSEKDRSKSISRRSFLGNVALVAAASAILQARNSPGSRGWVEAAQAASTDLVHDTFNGLLAFIVPGPDAYSVSQGVTTLEPGGVEAGVIDVLIATLDESTPFLPQFSATVAAVLNGLAQVVKPFSPVRGPCAVGRTRNQANAVAKKVLLALRRLRPQSRGRPYDSKRGENLWVLPLTGDGTSSGQPFSYLSTDFHEGGGRFSPDGRWIAYRSNETRQNEIYVGSFPASSAVILISSGGGREPRWRRVGRELLYLGRRGQVMAVEVATSPAFG